MMTQNRLHKRHEALHFHCARESIVAVIASYLFIEGALNPASALNMHWIREKKHITIRSWECSTCTQHIMMLSSEQYYTLILNLNLTLTLKIQYYLYNYLT